MKADLTLTKEELQRVKTACEDILDGAPIDTSTGLCGNLELSCVASFTVYKLTQFYATWEYYSGNHTFPVPATVRRYKGDESKQYILLKNKWVRKQGKLRRDLTKHILTNVVKELELNNTRRNNG